MYSFKNPSNFIFDPVALKIISVAGEMLEIGGNTPDAPGYDLLALMTGSEGMLGIIVEISLKLLPQPVHTQILLAAFATVDSASNGVAAIIAAGIVPAGLEMMDNAGIRAVEAYVHAGYPVGAAAILLCEMDGTKEEVADETQRVEQILQQVGATEVRIAKDKKEGEKFWAGRKAAFPAVGRIAADYYCMDGTIPRKKIAEVLKHITELSKQFGLGVVNVFHAGDGNLHPLILYDVNVPGELERAEAFGGKILETCVAAGGTITGEHGVGLAKKGFLPKFAGDVSMQVMRELRKALDPKGILNPGKMFD